MSGKRKTATKKKPKPRNAQLAARRVAPVAVTRTLVSRTPRVQRRKDSVVIAHREYFLSVGTVGASGTFEVTSLQVNPGNPAMFPWLASQAFGWEMYRFNRLTVEYVPRCATTQPGSLVLSPDYDAADDPPVNEAMACSYADTVSSAAWTPVSLRMRKEPMAGGMKSKFVRVGALKSNLDIKMYDCAALHVCRESGGGTTPVWGKLWVDYEVELITPHTIPVPWTSTYSAANQTTPQPAAAPFLGTAVAGNVVETAGPISITNSTPNSATNSNTVNIDGLVPGAHYIIQLIVEAAQAATNVVSVYPGFTGLQMLNILTSGFTWTPGAAGTKTVMNELLVAATAASGTFVAALSGAAIRGAQLIVSPITPDPAWTLL